MGLMKDIICMLIMGLGICILVTWLAYKISDKNKKGPDCKP